MTVLEIFTFDATDAYIADPVGTFKDLKASHSGLEGLLSFHHGPQVENPSKGSCYVTWDKLDSFNKVVDEARQQQRVEIFQLAVKDNAKLQLFDIGNADVSKISGAQMTEITLINLKEGKTKAELEKLVKDIDDASRPIEACHGIVLGTDVKEEGNFLVTMGWDSVEDHLSSVQNVPAYTAIAQVADSVITLTGMHHAKLTAVEF